MGLASAPVKEEGKKRRGTGGTVMKEAGVAELCQGKKTGSLHGEPRKGRNDT